MLFLNFFDMCLHPISIKSKDSYGLDCMQSVPCGKCLECLKDRQNAWKIRLVEEARDHKYVYFFTLTYNDDSVPFSYDDEGNKLLHFRKSDLQLWLKRHRISYERLFKREVDFKYFITSEYGPNTGRPHYHGILFTDVSPTFISSMFNDWKELYGFTNFSEVGKCGKKKIEVAFLLSEIMLRSIALNRYSSPLQKRESLTNLSKLDYYRPLLGLCRMDWDYPTLSV